MNVTQFACLQRESLIKLIYDSCVSKQKVFSEILQIAEQIQTRNSKSMADDSVEELLYKMKAYLAFTNQDISAYIDLALQQVKIAKSLESQKIITKINLEDTDDEEVIEAAKKNEQKKLDNKNIPEVPLAQQKNPILTGQKKKDPKLVVQSTPSQHQEEKKNRSKKQLRFADEVKGGIDTPIASSNLKDENRIGSTSHAGSSRMKVDSGKLNQVIEPTAKENRQKISVTVASRNESEKSGKNKGKESAKLQDIDEFEMEADYKEYRKELMRLEENEDIRATPWFLSKENFVARKKAPGISVSKQLNLQDMAFITRVVEVLSTQKQAAKLLLLSPRFVSKVFQQKRRSDEQKKVVKISQLGQKSNESKHEKDKPVVVQPYKQQEQSKNSINKSIGNGSTNANNNNNNNNNNSNYNNNNSNNSNNNSISILVNKNTQSTSVTSKIPNKQVPSMAATTTPIASTIKLEEIQQEPKTGNPIQQVLAQSSNTPLNVVGTASLASLINRSIG